LRGHCNQILLYNKKNKVRDALRARFDRLACLTGSLAKYVKKMHSHAITANLLTYPSNQ
jgi:hypothetical protein